MIKIFFLFSSVWVNFETFGNGQTVVRGIPSQRVSFYNPSKDFTCLDGSVTLPFSYVNDDYCDCPDGTDEPGTPACPHGIFYCANKGYIPKSIPSGFVNDGFCDCCDASDEYANSNCTDTCDELGLEAKRLAEKITQMNSEGSRIRAQMIASAKKVLESKQKRVGELENEKAEAIRLKDEAEVVKKDAEAKEAAVLEEFNAKEDAEKAQKAQEIQEEDANDAKDCFESFDLDANGIVEEEEMKVQDIFDQNKDNKVSSEELKFIEGKTVTLGIFKEIVWPRIKPLIVMNKIKLDEHLAPIEGQDAQPESGPSPSQDLEKELDRHLKSDGEPEEEELELEEEEDEGAEEEQQEHRIPESPEPKYDEETASIVKAANEAREYFEKTSRVVQDIEREMANLKNFLSKDYGEEDEFVPLDGQCFTYTDREYSYKLCPFDQVTQMGKSGGGETRLGIWSGWGDKTYSIMLYDKGQSCWNGPQRSTKVIVGCGLENEVISATEPNKCEYILEFKTPAACRLDDKPKDVHEEL